MDAHQSEGVTTQSTSNSDVENHDNPVAEGPLPNNHHIYRQDVVKHNDKTMIGVVTEVAGDSDSESDITDDDSDSDADNDKEEHNAKTKEAEEEQDDQEDNNNDDSEESSDDNKSSGGHDHRQNPLTPDQIRVLWMDDTETIHDRREVTVVDRGFLHGDYIASALDPTGQVGLIVDVNISVDLLAPDGSVINNISSKELIRVRDFAVGDFVVSGPWLGRVDDVLDNVTVLFDDGSVCKVMRAEPLRLRPMMAKSLLDEGQCPYHPGQRVRASSSTVFKRARWISGTWKPNRLEGTVVKVTVASVFVHWIASAGHGPDSSVSPQEEQSPKKLKLLSCFTHANWQLGDWCLLPSLSLPSVVKGLSEVKLQESSSGYSDCDGEEGEPIYVDGIDKPKGDDGNAQSSSVGKETVHENWHTHRKKLRKVVLKRDKKVRKKEENFDRALLIVNTSTSVDVAWQDGTLQKGLNSTLLIPIESPGDHDFVAEQYVVEKAGDESEENSEIKHVGVVRSVDAKEKTACVRWLKPVTRPEDQREFGKEEIVSVYELEGHPDYDYCYGDVVVRLSPVCTGIDGEKNSGNACGENKEGNEVDEESGKEFSDLSWVGNITGLRNGDIEVTWADGMVSTVGPQAVYVVGRDDDESIVGGSDGSDAASWETIEDNEMDDALNNIDEKQNPELEDTNTDPVQEISIEEPNNTLVSGPLSIPLAAVGYVARLASGIFSRGRGPHNTLFESDSIFDAVHPISDPAAHNSGVDVIEGQTDVENMVDEEGVEGVEGLSNVGPGGGGDDDMLWFKRFDTAKDPVDHFFLGSDIPGSSGRKWLKKVQRDWNILQNNLPDGIYVRVYEDRMDLLRGVIVGAYGTPYQDGLFFFDFYLPSEYPDVPPSAHYHSGGWRINPNLYEEGKVCLSLLNTWTGRGNEVWDPQSSSILQVLVSLQGLVLNSKPYFNEAGYDKQVGTAEGEKNSLSYNENTFLLNCKTMMHLIRRPPKDFEDLVKEHFKRRGYYILKACDTYMKGYLIGSLSKDASITDKSEANATSVGFKLMLAKIAPKLFSSLSEVGADCDEFKHMQHPTN